MTRIWSILTWVHEILKISTLIGSFCAKHITFDLTKYRGVIFHDTEKWSKIWRKTGSWFEKWHEEYGKFSPEHLESLKFETLIRSFYLKYKMYEFKIYRGVMCHNNEEWCKIWRGIDLPFQNWHEEFDKFWPEHSKVSKIFPLMAPFEQNT